MKFQCKGHNTFNICHITAHLYYWGVRKFGGGHEQYRGDGQSIKVTDAVESMDDPQFSGVFEGMDADEARDAANPYLPEEKVSEYYDRAQARYNRTVEEAKAKGIDLNNL